MVNPVSASLNLTWNMLILNVFHVSQLKPYLSSPVTCDSGLPCHYLRQWQTDVLRWIIVLTSVSVAKALLVIPDFS